MRRTFGVPCDSSRFYTVARKGHIDFSIILYEKMLKGSLTKQNFELGLRTKI